MAGTPVPKDPGMAQLIALKGNYDPKDNVAIALDKALDAMSANKGGPPPYHD